MIVNESSTNEDENELLNLNNSNDLSDRTHDYSPTAKIVKLQNYPNSDNLLI